MSFEDIKICCPSGYDEILRRLYGNYWNLPSEEKQKPKFIEEFIDFLIADVHILNTTTKIMSLRYERGHIIPEGSFKAL